MTIDLVPEALADRLRSAPVLQWPDRAKVRVAEWLETLEAEGMNPAGFQRPGIPALLAALAEHAPFLWRLVTMDAARCLRLFDEAPETGLQGLLARLDEASDGALPEADFMRELRRAKQSVALLVAIADLGGVWSLAEVTEALTRFADTVVRIAVAFLLRASERAGKLLPASTDGQERGCGLVVLALGKQGGRELNYSSDIDLVVLFDPKAVRLPPDSVPSQLFVRMTQGLVRILQERTADGYVLRVDLRLRPDPASTTVAIGLPSAFSYYESYGQNWERAAFIKARPVGGDQALGERFLNDLTPFVWRKYFDFGAIADIHAMKRQIHAVRGQAEVAVAGHNVKLGRGGIREIEFFVQTQQLIFGGRRPQLRGRQTLVMLEALAEDGWIDGDAVSDLSDAYRFLRTIEHRLQMIADEQTQRLPLSEPDLEGFARFAGFSERAAFATTLTAHLRRVEAHYARLFEHAPGLDAAAGNLVFTGTGDDPETLATLTQMGFARPEVAAEIIRGWHFGRRAGVQSPRARELLTELVPVLLAAFGESGDPDAAIATMDSMLGRMPAAVELLSLLRENAALRDLFADILGSAPRLAATIAARPHVLDAAIDQRSFRGEDHPAHSMARAHSVLGAARNAEDFLDRLRDVAQEELFLNGLRLLSGVDDPMQAAERYTSFAATAVRAALDRCVVDFAAEHGSVPGGACVVLGMGKLGSGEMTAASDLDLIVIYRFDPEAGDSDGRRPLDAARYYTRLTQRLIAALTVPTRRGGLYDVDVRLRPSGRQGPLAVQLNAFVRYQASEAQTWEHMALTRARVIAGDPMLATAVEDGIREVLLRPRDPDTLRLDIRTMRARVAKEKGEAAFWDMKLVAGGLLDIDFAAQFLALDAASVSPGLLQRKPSDVLGEARRVGLIDDETSTSLLEAYRLQTAASQLMRLTTDGVFDVAKAGAGVIRRLCAAANQPDLSALQSELADRRTEVRAILRRLLDWPA